MRILIWGCAVLMLANVAVYFWPDSANSVADVYAAQGEVNPNFIRLNKEIEMDFQDKSASQILSGDESGLNQSQFTQRESAEDNCYRLGPFLHRENFELAKAVLFNASVDFNSSKRVSKESKVFRVYLGEFNSRADVIEARAGLRRNNVLDHFVRKLEGDRFLISLGIYTTLESAQSAAASMSGSVDRVKVRDEMVVLPDSFWLHFSLGNDESIFRQLSKLDWGEQSAKLGRFSCELAQK